MASNTIAGTVTVKVKFDISLWDAIKWRVAGREFREQLVKRLERVAEEERER